MLRLPQGMQVLQVQMPGERRPFAKLDHLTAQSHHFPRQRGRSCTVDRPLQGKKGKRVAFASAAHLPQEESALQQALNFMSLQRQEHPRTT